jgi:hypothetical protein
VPPVYHTSCNPVKPAEPPGPAIRIEPHPDHPESIATYITADGKALPLWNKDEVAFSLEVVAAFADRARAVA